MWGMPLLSNLALMMPVDPLALIFALRELVTVIYGPRVTHVFPDLQVKACGLFRAELCGTTGAEKTGMRG